MLRINYTLRQGWPKLSWVAVLEPGCSDVAVLHGEMVETREEWAVEAVWAGKFDEGDFDETDLVFGSGLRKRGSDIVFVSSATGVDRLWHISHQGKYFVSNTLPGLLSTTGLALDDSYKNYAQDIATVETKGLYRYVGKIPTTGPDVSMVYFKNILWNEDCLSEVDKIFRTPAFIDFKGYENYLKETAIQLGDNARATSRTFGVGMLVGLSTGYDSVAAAVVARVAGCREAATIVNATSLWRGSDSGMSIAASLSLACKAYRHDESAYSREIAVWAGSGGPGGRNLTLFDYPKPLCLFFSGGYGDTLWERTKQGLQEPVGDYDELLCEDRLINGVFVTLVPWWGIRRAAEIQKLSLLEEMQSWTLNNDYDRPIARRLAEESGVPRDTFGIRKKNTASNRPFWWPSTKIAHEKFNRYLVEHSMRPRSRFEVKLISFLCIFIKIINSNILKFVPENRKWKPWLNLRERDMLFVWANHTLRDEYYK